MNCPNCTTGKLKLMTDNIVDTECSVLTFWRCETCWTTQNVQFNNPIMLGGYSDPLRLHAMAGNERWDYWRCRMTTSTVYTLIAKKGYGLKRENIDTLNYDEVTESTESLPAYRLYELK
jgi:hypothetical protein